ncbi:hypothetical protein LWI28_025857 [Acer negundo]|uniref:Uncharacterized protein n=1 Tax=Acer negundo TaxID=4023 RepID=A0AAD5IXD2_ACENE|nr:hypothetical protein LWI28_025857 [Acer negundo]
MLTASILSFLPMKKIRRAKGWLDKGSYKGDLASKAKCLRKISYILDFTQPFDFKTCLFLLSVFALLAYCLFSIRDPTDQIPNFPEAVSLLKQGALEVQNKVGDARGGGGCDNSSIRCVPSWHSCKCFKTSLEGRCPLRNGMYSAYVMLPPPLSMMGAMAWALPDRRVRLLVRRSPTVDSVITVCQKSHGPCLVTQEGRHSLELIFVILMLNCRGLPIATQWGQHPLDLDLLVCSINVGSPLSDAIRAISIGIGFVAC